jgi:hypothetical protein
MYEPKVNKNRKNTAGTGLSISAPRLFIAGYIRIGASAKVLTFFPGTYRMPSRTTGSATSRLKKRR